MGRIDQFTVVCLSIQPLSGTCSVIHMTRLTFEKQKGSEFSINLGLWFPLKARSRHVRESKTILDSKPWIPDSLSVELGFRIPIVSGFIPDSLSCIQDSKAQDSGFHSKNFKCWIQDSTRKNFPDSFTGASQCSVHNFKTAYYAHRRGSHHLDLHNSLHLTKAKLSSCWDVFYSFKIYPWAAVPLICMRSVRPFCTVK